MESNFQNLLELFIELGGIAENICLREGGLGRGIFPLDSLKRAKIVTSKSLLIDRGDVCVSCGKYTLKIQVNFHQKKRISSI